MKTEDATAGLPGADRDLGTADGPADETGLEVEAHGTTLIVRINGGQHALFTEEIAAQLGKPGTLVVAVHAGFIDTDMAAAVNAENVSPKSVAQQIMAAVGADQKRCSPIPPARWSKRHCPTISRPCTPRSKRSGTPNCWRPHERRRPDRTEGCFDE